MNDVIASIFEKLASSCAKRLAKFGDLLLIRLISLGALAPTIMYQLVTGLVCGLEANSSRQDVTRSSPIFPALTFLPGIRLSVIRLVLCDMQHV